MQTSETIHPNQIGEVSGVVFREIGPYLNLRQGERYISIRGEEGNLTMWRVLPGVLRIACSLDGDSAALPPTPALLPHEPLTGWKIEEGEDRVEVQSGEFSLCLDKTKLSIDIAHAGGIGCGSYALVHAGSRLRCVGKMRDRAAVYGLGETTGYLDKRGERYAMWNSDVFDPHVPDMESLYQSIPLLIQHSEQGSFGLFIDHPGRLEVDLREEPDSFYAETAGGTIDLYVIAGPGMKEVVSAYTELTGRMEMPPLWALGYHQSRFSYMNQEEVQRLAQTFRDKEIPCDAIYLDIHYMDEYKVFTFDPERFPDPKQMVADLKAMGIRVVPVVDPGVKAEEGYAIYAEGAQSGYFCLTPEGERFVGDVWPGASVFPDFTDEAVRDWWGALHRFYVEHGISGIWNDMNEPSVFNTATKTIDPQVLHRNGGVPKTHEELHNLYGLLMCQATRRGLERLLQGERPFVLTRAGYAGIQRYAAVWTGDNRSYWEHMELFMAMGMNLGLSGVAFCGADTGGFMHHASGELLARWTQLGALTPFFRNHSAIDTRKQEPWSFGEEVERICREYIELRYRLMPYLYSLFYESSNSGLPVMRPLVLEYPQDRRTFNLSDQFLLGNALLVAPVCRPGREHRTVYLPEGIWYDFRTGARYEGGQHIIAHAPLDTLPLYVKAGGILPLTVPAQHTRRAEWADLNIHLYGRGGSEAAGGQIAGDFALYEDDGISGDYKHGKSNLMNLRFEETENRFTFGCRCEPKLQVGSRGGRTLLITVHALSFIPVGISGISPLPSLHHLEEEPTGWYYDKQDNHLYVKLRLADREEAGFVVEG
ncbi:TIM-barrel domain-containing protein [Paenibacillus sp. M1]|uniref:TIM-barrel domain-containing protein n=1 Tax=Paenibacillus haidiansis TaxID=1574488 RepID=A0ABU7W166_9BACL